MKVLTIVLGCLLLSMTASAAFINCPGSGGVVNSFLGGAGSDSATCAAFNATVGFHITSIDLRYNLDWSGGNIGPGQTNTVQGVFTITAGNPGYPSSGTQTLTRTGVDFFATGGTNNPVTQTISVFLTSVGAFTVGETVSVLSGGMDQASARVDIQYNQTADNIVPEPTTILSLGGGLLALAAFARRFKKA